MDEAPTNAVYRAPQFVDVFDSYRKSIKKVLPHLSFVGADQTARALLFNSGSGELRFDRLSGGEREIAFLIGQIERFGLKTGLFLLDEPELHLNPDLLRQWVSYIATTVTTGQVWVATHSLEAVEAAGQAATVVMERNLSTNLVDRVSTMSQRPDISVIARAVGTPAFSISKLRLIYIEGEETLNERERFARVCASDATTRFVECSSCGEVIKRLEAMRSLKKETGQPIRMLGIIDRDWRTKTETEILAKDHALYVMPVHEIENVFLHPSTVKALLIQNGNPSFNYDQALQSAADKRAGGWILESVLGSGDYTIPSPGAMKALAYSLSWSAIAPDIPTQMKRIADASSADATTSERLERALVVQARIYDRKRSEGELWRVCEGKEVTQALATQVGYADTSSLEKAVAAYWKAHPESLPEEVIALRTAILNV